MKAEFVDNEKSRALVTLREDEPIWRGQKMISPIPTGAIVRAYIPADASDADVASALEVIRASAAQVVTYRMPKGRYIVPAASPSREGKGIREVVLSRVIDPELLPLFEEAFAAVGL